MPRFGFFVVVFLLSCLVVAQQRTLVEVLENLTSGEDISFSYDPDLIAQVQVSGDFDTPEALISFLTLNSAIDVEEVGTDQFLLIPKRSKVRFQFSSSESNTLEPFYLDVIHGSRQVLYQNFLSDPAKPISFEWTPRPGDTVRIISTAHDPIAIPGNQLIVNLDQSIALKEKVTYLDEIVIQNYLAKGIALNLPDQTTSIDMADLSLIPGETDGDVLASLATLPGINTPDSRPGNLFIRGSSTDQNLILYNNIPIYHRGHYYGSISPYNPAVISNVTVSKNGFSPRLGGRVGGAIEIRSKDELDDYDSYGVGLNSLYGNVFVNTKVSPKLGLSLSARHSLPSTWISPKLREISTMAYSATVLTDPQSGIDFDDINVKYEDYNLNVIWESNAKNRFKLSGLYTNNATDYTLDSDTTSNLELITYDNEGISFEWDRSFSSQTQGKLVAFYSDYYSAYETVQNDLQVGDKLADIESENYLKDAGASYEVNVNNGRWNTITMGLATQWSRVRFEYGDVRRDAEPFIAKRTDDAFVHALYGNYKFKGLSRFYFQLGGRLEYYSETETPYFSPRLLLNYDLTDRVILKTSAGRYFQFLNQMKYLNFGNAGFDNELWRLADGRGIKTLSGDQGMIGGVVTLGRFVFDLEAYRKKVNNVNYASTFRLNPSTFYRTADWDIKGIDFFTKVQVADGLSLWGSYEYSEQTLAFDTLESLTYQYKYNRPHRFKMGGLYQQGRWKLSYSWKILSGLYGRSIDILAQLGEVTIIDTTPPPPPPPGSPPPPAGMRPTGPRFRAATIDDLPVRYETFHGFDFFATYQVPRNLNRKWDVVVGLSLINVLNVENQIDQVVRGATQRNLNERYGLGFSPNLNITLKW